MQKLVSYLGRIFEKVSIIELRTFTTDFRIRPDLCVVSIFSRDIHCRLSYVVRRSMRERKVTNTQGYSLREKTRPTQYSCGILQLISYICLLYYLWAKSGRRRSRDPAYQLPHPCLHDHSNRGSDRAASACCTVSPSNSGSS